MTEVTLTVRSLIVVLLAAAAAKSALVEGSARGTAGILRIAAMYALVLLACSAVTFTVIRFRPGRFYWALEVK